MLSNSVNYFKSSFNDAWKEHPLKFDADCLYLSCVLIPIRGGVMQVIDLLDLNKRERRQAERKWRNTKLAIFKDLYEQAKHKVSILVHTAKCKFYT